MDGITEGQIIEWAGKLLAGLGITGGGGIGLALLVRYLWRKFGDEGLAMQRMAWETEYIPSLHREIDHQAATIERLSTQNALLHGRVIELSDRLLSTRTSAGKHHAETPLDC